MELIYPCKEYLDSYIEAYEEYKNNNITTYALQNPYEEDLIKIHENFRNGINIPENFVKQITYWLVEDGEWIGQVGIRPELNDNLIKRGGNIGYGIKYNKWNMGYGTKILKMALEKAKDLGLDKVLITCYDTNYASARVIEKNGGILQDKIVNQDTNGEILTRRYYIILN